MEIKKWIYVGVGYVVTLVVAFAVGRYMVPEKIKETTKVEIVTVEKQVVVIQEKLKVEYVKDTNQQQAIHREEHITTHPDGLKEEFKTEDINVTTVIKEHDVQYVDRVVERETVKYQDRIVEKEKIVEAAKAQWRVSGLVGYDFPEFELTNPKNGLVFGGLVERRVLGPFSAGVWGMTSKAGGLSLSLEF